MSSRRPFNLEQLKNYRVPVKSESYCERACMLYALGVGAGLSDLDETSFVFERKLQALPTMALVLGIQDFWCMDPAAGLDWPQILHAEQTLTLYRPIEARGFAAGEATILDVADKGPGKAALILARRRVRDDEGSMLAEMDEIWIVRGGGGFGGKRELDFESAPPMPQRKYDTVIDLPTSRQQAMIYRLSGDTNPLHIEADTARLGGFDKPILHGLSTMGVVGRALIHRVCGGDASRLSSMRAKFTAPVLPGESIRTEIWIEGAIIRFRASVPSRGVVVIDGGSASLDSFAKEPGCLL